MTGYTNHQGCEGTPEGNERLVDDMGYSLRERAFLDLIRLYLLTFTDPTSHGWMKAGSLASAEFGPALGPRIAHELLGAVNSVRLIRASPLEFSNPNCPGCTKVLCEAERQFISTLQAVLSGQWSAAHAHAMLLCEGDDSTGLLAGLKAVAALLAAEPASPRQATRGTPAPYRASY